MKVKLKDKENPMPYTDSFCGLSCGNWEKINSGQTVELKEIPDVAKKYLVEVKDAKS